MLATIHHNGPWRAADDGLGERLSDHSPGPLDVARAARGESSSAFERR
jgi:hypothetical protein